MNILFNELDHRLSVVKRWGIAHTIQTQSVAEHVFNVERIAVRIAKAWFNITDETALFRIAKFAHHHDDHEALTGDLPTMVKPYFDEEAFEKDHIDLLPLPPPLLNNPIQNIVKLADMLEGYHFLCMEKTLGNSYLDEHLEHEGPRIIAFIHATWPKEFALHDSVNHVMWDMRKCNRSTRHSKRGR